MADDPRNQPPSGSDDPPYRVYRSGRSGRPDERVGAGARARSGSGPGEPASPRNGGERPYTTYRSGPRGLRERLRGEPDTAPADERGRDGGRRGSRDDDGGTPGARRLRGPRARRPISVGRVARWVLGIVVFWLLLSLVLFLISAQVQSGSIPGSAKRALSSGPNMLTGTDTILVLGTDQRPKGSKEPGAFGGGIRSDSIMLWRIGGGTSRRLSIPRDTVASIPGHGSSKINAAYAYGGPALAIRTIEQFTGVTINHVIVVNLANFPRFIDAVGGVDVHTGRICSSISGGVKNGGFTLNLRPGDHHLSGRQALTLARTRENSCNAASNDLTRDGYQQKILNAIKSKLTSPGIVPRLPWTAWAAPKAVRTDMGGPTMLSLFGAAEIGGSAPTDVLKPARSLTLPDGEDALQATPGQVHRAVQRLMHGN